MAWLPKWGCSTANSLLSCAGPPVLVSACRSPAGACHWRRSCTPGRTCGPRPGPRGCTSGSGRPWWADPCLRRKQKKWTLWLKDKVRGWSRALAFTPLVCPLKVSPSELPGLLANPHWSLVWQGFPSGHYRSNEHLHHNWPSVESKPSRAMRQGAKDSHMLVWHIWHYLHIYYMDPYNAVECSIYINGTTLHSMVSYFVIMDLKYNRPLLRRVKQNIWTTERCKQSTDL